MTTTLGHGVIAVDTNYVRPRFDATHLIVEQGRAAYVDTGTYRSVPLLLAALDEHDIDRAAVEYLFVTHVHLDHAGGAGELLKHLPNATVILHPRGAPHMLDPHKLVRGTIAVYGEQRFHDMYEQVVPVPAERLRVCVDDEAFSLAGRELRCLFTAGHARHHYCVHDATSASVFSGDSFGVSYRELDTPQGEFIFPSTTPIDFDPLEAHRSVDRIMACAPEQVLLTHYSRVRNLDRLAGDLHAGIDEVATIAMDCALESEPEREAAIATRLFAYFEQRLQTLGYSGEPAQARQLLQFDVQINAKGLDVWLQRKASH